MARCVRFVEEDVAPPFQRLADRLDGGAVAVAVHLGPLGELVARDHLVEDRAIDEVVVDVVLLAAPRRARGVGHRKLDARLAPLTSEPALVMTPLGPIRRKGIRWVALAVNQR